MNLERKVSTSLFLALQDQFDKTSNCISETKQLFAKHPKHKELLQSALDDLWSAWDLLDLTAENGSFGDNYSIGETLIASHSMYVKIADNKFLRLNGSAVVCAFMQVKRINTKNAVYTKSLNDCLSELNTIIRMWEKLTGTRRVPESEIISAMVLDGTPFRRSFNSTSDASSEDHQKSIYEIYIDHLYDRIKSKAPSSISPSSVREIFDELLFNELVEELSSSDSAKQRKACHRTHRCPRRPSL